MKKIFTFLSLIVMVILISTLICTTAFADKGESAKLEIMETVKEYLENYSTETLLYIERSLTENTVFDNAVIIPIGAESVTYMLSDGVSTVAEMRENIAYIKAKAEYWMGVRQMQMIYRRDLKLTYDFEDVAVSDKTARVLVHEYATYVYTDCTEPTFEETVYTVDLVNLSDRWLIADVTDNDWFDARFKEKGKLGVNKALTEFEACQKVVEPCAVTGPKTEVMVAPSVMPLSYNGRNAAAYAYTYSGTEKETSSFYNNELFNDYRGKGGDCMNFASQCIWAGFYGDQQKASVDAKLVPMDNEGSYVWYGGINENSASWKGTKSFLKYIEASKNAQDVGMSAEIITVENGANIMASLKKEGIDPNRLVGAVALVDGQDANGNSCQYGHAVVITDVTDTALYYCGHTRNRQHAKLNDGYMYGVKIIVPYVMRLRSIPNYQIKAEMLRPVSVGSQQTIKATASSDYLSGKTPSINFGRLVISITSPSGVESSCEAGVGESRLSYLYTFAEEGLYAVTCSLEFGGSFTFYVRVN